MARTAGPPLTQPAFSWREIGRPCATCPQDWTVWMAPVPRSEDYLYRTLALADGSVSVVIDLHPARGSGMQTVYRAQCEAAQDPGETAGRVWELLATSDGTATRVLENRRPARGKGAAGRQLPCAEERGAQRGGATAAQASSRLTERRIRERAYLLWEREGRPLGRSDEFWERAHQQERAS
jgi:hypothetical protein